MIMQHKRLMKVGVFTYSHMNICRLFATHCSCVAWPCLSMLLCLWCRKTFFLAVVVYYFQHLDWFVLRNLPFKQLKSNSFLPISCFLQRNRICCASSFHTSNFTLNCVYCKIKCRIYWIWNEHSQVEKFLQILANK